MAYSAGLSWIVSSTTSELLCRAVREHLSLSGRCGMGSRVCFLCSPSEEDTHPADTRGGNPHTVKAPKA